MDIQRTEAGLSATECGRGRYGGEQYETGGFGGRDSGPVGNLHGDGGGVGTCRGLS